MKFTSVICPSIHTHFGKLLVFIPLSILSGCYLVIPRHYLINYEKVRKQSVDSKYIDFNSIYVYTDSVIDQSLSRAIGEPIRVQRVFTLYRNHLSAYVTLPRKTRSGNWIITVSDYTRSISHNELDQSVDIKWEYYTVLDSTVTLYSYDFTDDQFNIFSKGRIVYAQVCFHDSNAITCGRWKTIDHRKPRTAKYIRYYCAVKPDTSQSELECRLRLKGTPRMRRIYPLNSPHYLPICNIK